MACFILAMLQIFLGVINMFLSYFHYSESREKSRFSSLDPTQTRKLRHVNTLSCDITEGLNDGRLTGVMNRVANSALNDLLRIFRL